MVLRLLLSILLIPSMALAEALPKSFNPVACEAFFGDAPLFLSVDPAITLDNALDKAFEHLESGGFEANFRRYFKPSTFRVIRSKTYEAELAALKSEKIELLKEMQEMHHQRISENSVDELWVKKLTFAISWVVDFVIELALPSNQGAFIWNDIPKYISRTREAHVAARKELESERPESRQVREVALFTSGFQLRPVLGALDEKQMVFAVLNRVHLINIVFDISRADGAFYSPFAFVEHDRIHARNIEMDFAFDRENQAALERMRAAFFEGYSDLAEKEPVLDQWLIEFMFWFLHEDTSRFRYIVERLDGAYPELSSELAAQFSSYAQSRLGTTVLEEEANLIYTTLLKVLQRGGY